MVIATVQPQAAWIPCLHTKKSLKDTRTHRSCQRLACLVFLLNKMYSRVKNLQIWPRYKHIFTSFSAQLHVPQNSAHQHRRWGRRDASGQSQLGTQLLYQHQPASKEIVKQEVLGPSLPVLRGAENTTLGMTLQRRKGHPGAAANVHYPVTRLQSCAVARLQVCVLWRKHGALPHGRFSFAI